MLDACQGSTGDGCNVWYRSGASSLLHRTRASMVSGRKNAKEACRPRFAGLPMESNSAQGGTLTINGRSGITSSFIDVSSAATGGTVVLTSNGIVIRFIHRGRLQVALCFYVHYDLRVRHDSKPQKDDVPAGVMHASPLQFGIRQFRFITIEAALVSTVYRADMLIFVR
jgi:hypothetical protein